MACVLVTRPEGQSASLCQKIKQNGHKAYAIPMLTITPLVPNELQLSDCFIFLSVNAVRYLPIIELPKQAQVFAIGRATHHALIERGIAATATPRQACSEGLLALDCLQDVAGKVVTVVSGVGGRDLLFNELTDRGARCHRLEVYERCPSDVGAELNVLLSSVTLTHVMISSVEGLECFVLLMKDHPQKLQAMTLIVISQRVAERAKALGVKAKVVVSDEASDDGFCRALGGLVNG
jgi:uroporphyrinogen-III synthase